MIPLKKYCPGCNKLWSDEEQLLQCCASCEYPEEQPIDIDELDNFSPDET